MFSPKKPSESKPSESKSSDDHIYLYHLIDSEEAYKKILEKGLFSSAGLGKPIPNDPKSAEKSFDIFFHPLRKNETIADLPFSSIDKSRLFVAIAVPLGAKLQVNNRLYSFGLKPLSLINLDDYFTSYKYTEEGLPEVRIKIQHIPPEFISVFGSQDNHTISDTIVPLNLEDGNFRFNQAAPQKRF